MKKRRKRIKKISVSEIAHQISDGSLNSIIASMIEKGEFNLTPVDFFPPSSIKVVNT